MTDRRLSKRLAYVLRHDPASLGLTVDRHGWTQLASLLEALAADGMSVDRARIEHLVTDAPRRRFELDDIRERIRARYGHSLPVDPPHGATVPPSRLYHGTHPAALERILTEGLRPMDRRQVHLSPDPATAREVGARRGRPVVLAVDAAAMHRDGHVLREAGPTVWLTDAVPPGYLRRT